MAVVGTLVVTEPNLWFSMRVALGNCRLACVWKCRNPFRSIFDITLEKSTVSSVTVSYESSYYDVINLACVIYFCLRAIFGHICAFL